MGACFLFVRQAAMVPPRAVPLRLRDERTISILSLLAAALYQRIGSATKRVGAEVSAMSNKVLSSAPDQDSR